MTSRKAKEWLMEHSIEFEEVNWQRQGMTSRDFYKLLSLTENGTDEIISQRSSVYPSFSENLPHLKLSDVFSWVYSNRSLLRLPLIMDEKRLLVGYNSDEIRRFIPREARDLKMRQVEYMMKDEELSLRNHSEN